mmetsp:Transcript_139744/g.243354  ORF Transcript_139744/g.243354 Transcript_139744/m.243354 type:complete len:656 (+) Transcript_139744:112-2079(+)
MASDVASSLGESSPPGSEHLGINSSTESLHKASSPQQRRTSAHNRTQRQSIDDPVQEQSDRESRGMRWFHEKPHEWRRYLIQRPWIFPVAAMHLAATNIQRAWRPCWLRRAKVSSATGSQRNQQQRQRASTALTSIAQAQAGRSASPFKNIATMPEQNEPEEDAGLTEEEKRAKRGLYVRESLQKRYLFLLKRQYDAATESSDRTVSSRSLYPSFEHYCAAFIQNAWLHQRKGRRKAIFRVIEYRRQTLYHIAASEIQHYWIEARARLQVRRARQEQDRREGHSSRNLRLEVAATRIQRMWRRTNDYRIFVALREIIASFRGTGEPYQLLRSILPRESMLLDPSMQVHLRFRLGGTKFPPSIYYKIFTHGCVVDLGSFAPRNYAGERMGFPQGEEDWYTRVENNGWRPLVVRRNVNRGANKDEVEKATARKVIRNFHHSRLRRRQDIEWERKQRTRAWMRKLYSLDLPQAPKAPQARRSAAEEKTAAGAPAAPGGAARLSSGGTRGVQQKRPQPSGRTPRPPPGPAPLTQRPRPPSRTSMSSSTAGAIGTYGDLDDEVDEAMQTKAASSQQVTGSDWKDMDTSMGQAQGEDFSDDQLLEWSKQLDFDAYLQSWQMIATSDASEGSLPIGTLQSTAATMAAPVMRSPPHTMIGLVH